MKGFCERSPKKKKLKENISSSSLSPPPKASAGTSHYLPHDLLFAEILARLPAKTLCRFKLVSRPWRSAISEAIFAREQSRHESPTSSGMIYCDDNGRFKFLPTQGTSVGVPCPSRRFQSSSQLSDQYRLQLFPTLKLVTSTHGLIMVTTEHNNSMLYVCNPATGEHERIPPISGRHYWLPPHYLLPPGLAFDPSTSPDEYKIVLSDRRMDVRRMDAQVKIIPIERYMDAVYQTFWIFSSASGEWTESSPKKLCCPAPPRMEIKPVFAAGVIYWYCRDYIVSYNVSEDIARVITLPPWLHSIVTWNDPWDEIGTWEDRLTCTRMTHNGLEMWVMDMDGKWSLKHHIHMKQIIQQMIESKISTYYLYSLRKPLPKWKSLDAFPLPYYGGNNLYFRIFVIGLSEEAVIGCDIKGHKVVVLSENQLEGRGMYFFHSYHNSLVALPRQPLPKQAAIGRPTTSALFRSKQRWHI